MSLNSSNTASILYSNWSGIPASSTVALQKIATILDAGFQKAVPQQPNFIITGVAGTLKFNATNIGSCEVITPNDIAVAVSDYWSKAILPGSPVSCDRIKSVINDAPKVIPIITAGLTALGSSATESNPPYQQFVDVIFNAVKTIIWTIEESDSDCGTTITAGVS